MNEIIKNIEEAQKQADISWIATIALRGEKPTSRNL